MIGVVKKLWGLLTYDEHQRQHREQSEQYKQLFEDLIEQENRRNNDLPSIVKENIIDVRDQIDTRNIKNDDVCFRKNGTVTALNSNDGFIDKDIFFDMSVAVPFSSNLKVGNRVQYLAYQKSHTDHIRVVKIEEIIGHSSEESNNIDSNINGEVESLKHDKPTIFETRETDIYGLVIQRDANSIFVETDQKKLEINMDEVEISFIPEIGDSVILLCIIKNNRDKIEILKVKSINPNALQKGENCTVRALNSNYGILNDNCYFTYHLEGAKQLKVGDLISADLIESERDNYSRRCIKFSLIGNYLSQNSENATMRHVKATITPNLRCVFSNTNEEGTCEMVIKNNTEKPMKNICIEFHKPQHQSQVTLVDPDPNMAFEIEARGELTLSFKINTKFLGFNREPFCIRFETFDVKRTIFIIVDENEKLAEQEKENKEIDNSTVSRNYFNTNKKEYSYQLLSNKNDEVIPGVQAIPKRRFIHYRIGNYEIPERLHKAYLISNNKEEMENEIEEVYPCIKEELNFKNYSHRFQTLIFLEEIAHFVNFRNFDRDRAHFSREGEYLSLEIEDLSERRPSLVIGDTVRAINPWGEKDSNRSYDGIVHKVLLNRVLLKFDSTFHYKYNGEDYKLKFFFSRFPYRKQHYAVSRIVNILNENFLFPRKMYLRNSVQFNIRIDDDENLYNDNEPSPWHNTTLNRVQKRAVYNIMSTNVNMPYVVFGPPGTGKTMTLVETVLQLVKNSTSARILVGTPSNSSAELITTRLIESKALREGSFIRLVSQNHIERGIIPEHLLRYCATVDIGIDGTCEDSMHTTTTGVKLHCQSNFLGKHRVTIGTCSTLGNFLQMRFSSDHFTHVLIDEAGQCTEPDTMVVISQVSKNRGQVVLFGDPKQLQPIIINHLAAERGLSLSFMERILSYTPYERDLTRYPDSCGRDPRIVTKLLNNYRSLPSILNVYNELFYNSELLPMVDEENSREAILLKSMNNLLPESKSRSASHGVFFYGLQCENLQDADSPSWYNPLEAKNVFLFIIKCYRQGNIKAENIGVIAPYSKQVKSIRNCFATYQVPIPKIGSVEEFQGHERDIIIISTVRSNYKQVIKSDLRYSLGFVKSPKRMNVAVSRSRCLVYIFGNPHLLCRDPNWCKLIRYCVDNDAYLGTDLPISLQNFDLNRSISNNDDYEKEEEEEND